MSPTLFVALAFLSGCVVGGMLPTVVAQLDPADVPEQPPGQLGQRTFVWAPTVGILFAACSAAVLYLDSQRTPDTIPQGLWLYGRLAYHLLLLSLLLAATATDLEAYVIPDHITFGGMALGVLGAFLSGQTQLVHLWVDWSHEIPGLRGQDTPAWIARHPHWHGLAYSLTGLIVGGSITWLVRQLGTWILGEESMGLGDVTLMAMIGSFLGWQPTIIVFLLAPLCGVVVGATAKLLGRRRILPYGPCLAMAALLVMFGWRWIWMLEVPLPELGPRQTLAVRRLFGDPWMLAVLGCAALTGVAGLLGLVRLYRALPVDRRR